MGCGDDVISFFNGTETEVSVCIGVFCVITDLDYCVFQRNFIMKIDDFTLNFKSLLCAEECESKKDQQNIESKFHLNINFKLIKYGKFKDSIMNL